jgi:hypothetical protein
LQVDRITKLNAKATGQSEVYDAILGGQLKVSQQGDAMSLNFKGQSGSIAAFASVRSGVLVSYFESVAHVSKDRSRPPDIRDLTEPCQDYLGALFSEDTTWQFNPDKSKVKCRRVIGSYATPTQAIFTFGLDGELVQYTSAFAGQVYKEVYEERVSPSQARARAVDAVQLVAPKTGDGVILVSRGLTISYAKIDDLALSLGLGSSPPELTYQFDLCRPFGSPASASRTVIARIRISAETGEFLEWLPINRADRQPVDLTEEPEVSATPRLACDPSSSLKESQVKPDQEVEVTRPVLLAYGDVYVRAEQVLGTSRLQVLLDGMTWEYELTPHQQALIEEVDRRRSAPGAHLFSSLTREDLIQKLVFDALSTRNANGR